MLKQRIITALVLLPLVFVLLFFIRLDFFAAFVLVIVYLMSLEWAKLSGVVGRLNHTFFAFAVSSVNFAIWSFSDALAFWPSPSWPQHVQFDLPLTFILLSLLLIPIMVIIVVTYSKNFQWWQKKSIKCLFGIMLLPAFFASFVSIRCIGYGGREIEYGGKLLLFMLVLIWATDIGAYATGKMLGRNKLTSVSPNKTWEGAIGGIVFSLICGWSGIYLLTLTVSNLASYLLVILLLSVVSIYGDLFESALKRNVNVKDSGNLLPGHGGLLDRLDSTITVAPLYYLSFSYFEWFNV